VDGFCERALPCSEFSSFAQYDEIWHLDSKNGICAIKDILREEKNEETYVIC